VRLLLMVLLLSGCSFRGQSFTQAVPQHPDIAAELEQLEEIDLAAAGQLRVAVLGSHEALESIVIAAGELTAGDLLAVLKPIFGEAVLVHDGESCTIDVVTLFGPMEVVRASSCRAALEEMIRLLEAPRVNPFTGK
jgi:hypothetical protein